MHRSVTCLTLVSVLAFPTLVKAQSDQAYATYITEEQWQMVNELSGVDRQIVSRDIGRGLGIGHFSLGLPTNQ